MSFRVFHIINIMLHQLYRVVAASCTYSGTAERILECVCVCAGGGGGGGLGHRWNPQGNLLIFYNSSILFPERSQKEICKTIVKESKKIETFTSKNNPFY